MANENPIFVFIGDHPGFLARARAVAASTLPVSRTSVIVSAASAGAIGVAGKSPNADAVTTLDPTFKLIFWSTVAFTLLFVILTTAIAIWGPDRPAVHDLQSLFSHCVTLGFGGIVGLISGKAATPAPLLRK